MTERILKRADRLYFMGIGGTGMASVAGLMKAKGYQVSGSDQQLYPPMSGMLQDLGIQVRSPYTPDNLREAKPDLVVVANCLSRGHPEISAMLEEKIPYTSFPHLLGQTILKGPGNIVVAGTHGKTTSASIVAWCLEQLKLQPGFLIGGMPGNFPRSFCPGGGRFFVIEGDEYDSAFFDKESKFLHYRPDYLLLNHIEFDHADIFQNYEALEAAFEKLISLVEEPGRIIANLSDPGVRKLLNKMAIITKVSGVHPLATTNPAPDLPVKTRLIQGRSLPCARPGEQKWHVIAEQDYLGRVEFTSGIGGPHNLTNLCQALGLLGELAANEELPKADLAEKVATAMEAFKGVRRRLDFLGLFQGAEVYEDFAHHPTAVQQVIQGMRQSRPQQRILLAFDPANATSRRNIFLQRYCEVFRLADKAILGPVKTDHRIPEDQRMDPAKLAKISGDHVIACESTEQLLDVLKKELTANDILVIMSSGSFAGISTRLLESGPLSEAE